MAEVLKIPVPEEIARNALCTNEQYLAMYEESLKDPEAFWARQAERIDWIKKWDNVKNCSFYGEVRIRWFENGKLNVSANCIDRHLEKRGDQIAIIWEPDNPNEKAEKITFKELHGKVCKFANVLKALGVKKGDRVTIYLPMIPEAAYAMLACARIGAVHAVVFGGFSAESLANRILDCESHVIITADEGIRAGKAIPLKKNVDDALKKCPDVTSVLVVKRTGAAIAWNEHLDTWYHEAIKQVSADCEPEVMDAEDPLFILYTSGSTGKPKGVLHTTGGYVVYASMTHQYVFDYKQGEKIGRAHV